MLINSINQNDLNNVLNQCSNILTNNKNFGKNGYILNELILLFFKIPQINNHKTHPEF